MERTLIIIKPDGVQRGLVGPIIERFERRGLRLVGLKLVQVSKELARNHYAAHEGKAFFNGLIEYITSAPVIVMALEGKKAIEVARKTIGATNPANAEPGTIRADFALEIGRNLVHGSDGPEAAETEIALWFQPAELAAYERANDRWIFE